MKLFKKIKLAHWIVGITIIAILSTFFISMWSSNRFYNEAFIQKEQEMVEKYAEQIAVVANDYFKGLLKAFSNSADQLATKILSEEALIQEMATLKMQNHTLSSVIFVDKNGFPYGNSSDYFAVQDEFSKIQSEIEQSVKIGAIATQEKFKVLRGDKEIVIAYPVFSEKNEYVGFINGTVDFTALDVLRSLLEFLQDEGKTIRIVDAIGQPIFDVDDTVQKEITENGKTTLGFNEEIVVGYGSIPLANWEIAVHHPLEKEFIPLGKVLSSTVIFLLPFLLIAVSLVIWMAIKMVRPIQQLITSIDKSIEAKSIQHFEKIEGWNLETHNLKNAIMSSVSHIQKRITDLTKQLAIDPLTGIGNRRIMDEVLNEWIDNEVPFAIILVDLDYFKSVNDTYGHAVGDEVLKAFASTMQAVVDERGICCRYGGEEFIILLPYTSIDVAFEISEKLRANQALAKNPCGHPVTLSGGVAACSAKINTPEMLIKIADEALYEAKRSGRNCIRVADRFSRIR